MIEQNVLIDYLESESGNVHWFIPRVVNPLFTGREDIGNRLQNALCPDGHSKPGASYQRRCVIIGLGGTGKSEVCLKFAYAHRQK